MADKIDYNNIKRDLSLLWITIIASMAVVFVNTYIKTSISENSLLIGSAATAAIGVLLTLVYSIKLKPKFNQFFVFVFCLSISFSAIVFMSFNLEYKGVLAGVAVPCYLVLTGMLIYLKFVKEEVK